MDKSLFYYGKPYHLLIDSITSRQREEVIKRIPHGASVLDVGCGTGELGLAMQKLKDCKVVGVDLSKQMIQFANERNRYPDVTFLHRDATDISDFEDGYFDYGTVCMLLHELTFESQRLVLTELTRLTHAAILIDYNVPLANKMPGLIARLIEFTLGRDHYGNFKAYLEAGGLVEILPKSGIDAHVSHRSDFNQGAHQVIVLSGSPDSD